jgi:RHS repeat-associated protein
MASLSTSATSYAPAASVSTIGYAPHNALATETYGNSLIHVINYNNRLQPTQIKLGTAGSPTSILSITNNYGTTTNNGNLLSVSYAGGGLSYTQSFGYDAVNRLTTSQEGASWSQTNSYDRYGNRSIVGGVLTFSATNNRITNAGYTYDAAGNLTNDLAHTYSCDAENRVSKVDNVAAYVYDGEGRRVSKLVNENRRFIYGLDGQAIAEFSRAAGALQKEYIYGAGGLVATIEPGAVNANGTRYLTTDHISSPRVLTNSSAGVASRHDYMPFGEEILNGGRTSGMGYSVADGLRQKFTGKERDTETSLDYFIARYYSAIQGRFTSSDPGPLVPGDPQSFNRYAYVQNNPLKFIDPTGEILTIRGEDAGYLIGELERLTGYKLKHDTKTGVVTIDNSEKRKTGKGISDNLAKELEGAIGLKNAKGEDVTVGITTKGTDDKIFFDDFKSKTIDISDYKAFVGIEGDNSAFAAAQLGHVLNEYSKAETVYKGLESQGSGDTSPWFMQSHAQGLAAEGRVMGDFTGKSETAARGIVSGIPLVTFEYTSVRYLVVRQSQVVNGKQQISQSVEKITRRQR